ncbi:MAG: hypothetical protein HYW48_07260 [Deltaproteobacteria bacterium]|nr:hypothetical protein [Deltaproteobacteria bacterium]
MENKKAPTWEPCSAIPEHTITQNYSQHPRYGRPDLVHTYCNKEGMTSFFVYRFEGKKFPGGKVCLPVSYGKLNGKEGLYFKGPTTKAPLYNLREAIECPEKPVLIVEGEKTSDAAKKYFSDFVVVTSFGGSNSPHKSDWSPLKGKSVTIFGDNDEAGENYAERVSKLLERIAKTIKIVRLPNKNLFPKGWDLADEIPAGIAFRQIREAVLNAKLLSIEFPIQRNDEVYALDIAERLLRENFDWDGFRTLHFFNSNFYKYNGKIYERVEDSLVESEVMNFIKQVCLPPKVNVGFRKNVLEIVKAEVHLSVKKHAPFFLSSSNKSLNGFVTSNGILDLGDDGKLLKPHLQPHSPELFSTNGLNYPFEPNSSCEFFRKFLQEVVPDNEVRQLLQEWVGYNLVVDTSQHTFVLLLGDGGNGKSVFCRVMRLLLGAENVSSLSLDSFNASRTFALASTEGKLANICEDLSETSKISEGLLKQFVSGDNLSVERKFKDHFELTPTARLTFSSNSFPRFIDRSNGIWRRCIVIPFDQTIAESKKDPKLGTDEFWLNSGELPGILNWALEGLGRLREKGTFTKPQVCEGLKDEYRRESNPAAQFLEEGYCYSPGISEGILSTTLYESYRNFCLNGGFVAINRTRFSREIKKIFPGVSLSKNAVTGCSRHRSRSWVGLQENSGF